MSLINIFRRSSKNRLSFCLKALLAPLLFAIGLTACSQKTEPIVDSESRVSIRESLDDLILDFSKSFHERLQKVEQKKVFSGVNPRFSDAKIKVRKIEEKLARQLAGSEGTERATEYRVQAVENLLKLAEALSKDELLEYRDQEEFDELADEMEDRYEEIREDFPPAEEK